MRNLPPSAKPKRNGGRKSIMVFNVGHITTHCHNYHEVEVYLSPYYQTCIKSHVTACCKAKELKSAPIWLICDVAMEHFALEDQDVVDESQKETAHRAGAVMVAVAVKEEESEQTLEQYQQ